MSEWVDVARVEEFVPGTRREVDVDGAQVLVFNLDGAFYAIEDMCTHDYVSLTGGELQGDEIICPRHGARFCIRTGEVKLPPAYEPLATFPIQITGGMVQVKDARWD